LARMLIQAAGDVLGDKHGGLVGQDGGQERGGHSENPGVTVVC